VIGTNQEMAPSEVRPPVAHSLHQPNQLAFICSELQMTSGEWTAEVGEGSSALVEDGAKPRT